ncbi:hypothetical protein EDD17DRAFT_1550505, partial [Pisolithus thermaeus]
KLFPPRSVSHLELASQQRPNVCEPIACGSALFRCLISSPCIFYVGPPPKTMPPPKVEPPHKLAFATTNVWNTTFATEGGKFYNEIATHFWQPHLTRISKRDHEARVATCVAEIESLPKKEVKVRINTPHAEGEWIRASDFIKTN